MRLFVFFDSDVISEILIIIDLNNSLEFFFGYFHLISCFVNKTEYLTNKPILQSKEIFCSEEFKGFSKASSLFLSLKIECLVAHKESLDPHDEDLEIIIVLRYHFNKLFFVQCCMARIQIFLDLLHVI